MKRPRPALLLVPAVLLLAAWGTWTLSRSRTFQLAGELVARVDTGERVVALTFDDGPTPTHTPFILDVLRQEGVRATFYLEGRKAEQCPTCTRAMVEAGHELGNHTWSHQPMIFRSNDFFAGEVERTDTVLREAGVTGPITFRPPFCKKLVGLPRYLEQTGRTSVTWDVEPETDATVAASTDTLVAHTLEHVRPGSIVLLHVMYDARANSRAAVRPIIRGLKARGYRFVTVSELLALRS